MRYRFGSAIAKRARIGMVKASSRRKRPIMTRGFRQRLEMKKRMMMNAVRFQVEKECLHGKQDMSRYLAISRRDCVVS